MSTLSPVLTEIKDGVLTITLNRRKANAFNFEMIAALQEALKLAAREVKVRSVLLTGSGNVFSAGQDIREFQSSQGTSFRAHLQRTYNPLIIALRGLEKPVIAGINGSVAGAALGIALACDLRIAAEDARFVVGFLGIGLALDSATSLLLPLTIGLGRAVEAAFTNQAINTRQALEWGLVNRVVPAEELLERAFEWAYQLGNGPVRAMGLAKRDFNRAWLGNLEQVLDYEAHIQEIAGRGIEHKEGVQAFLEKRSPRFMEEAATGHGS